MKIEVDLNDIFCDEEGMPSESMQESVERQVVTMLSRKLEAGIGKQIDTEVARIISTKLQEVADTILPSLAADMIDAEYRPVGTYGNQGATTTFRKELVRVITANLQYKKARYASETNVFTKAVDSVIAENMKVFQSEFNAMVTKKFRDEALNYAVNSLKKTLSIKS